MRQQTPGDEIVDLRNVLERYNEIRAIPQKDRTDEDIDYLRDVRALKKQLWTNLEEYADNQPIMVADYHFEDYAQEEAVGLGFISRDALYDWPSSCIDWAEAAESLKIDFHEVTFGSDTYYVRTW